MTAQLVVVYWPFHVYCRLLAMLIIEDTTKQALFLYFHSGYGLWRSCQFESHSGEVHSMQYNRIKFVSDLRHVDGFLRKLRFAPPIKLTNTV